jgi:phosphohistidine phosphatase SixA
MIGEVQLVRHGDYDFDGPNRGHLTVKGREQAELAKDMLLAKQLGERVIILSSDAVRARETSDVIAAGLKAILVHSPRIRRGGENPFAVGHLETFLKDSLQADSESEVDPTDSSFVVVTHAPLIAAVTSQPNPDINYGGVYTAPSGWTNLGYSPSIAEKVLSGELE